MILTIMDNNGGFSHGGRSIVFYENGTFTENVYTDTDASCSKVTGIFHKKGKHLVIAQKGKQPEHFYQKTVNHLNYWLTPKELKRYNAGKQRVHIRSTAFRELNQTQNIQNIRIGFPTH